MFFATVSSLLLLLSGCVSPAIEDIKGYEYGTEIYGDYSCRDLLEEHRKLLRDYANYSKEYQNDHESREVVAVVIGIPAGSNEEGQDRIADFKGEISAQKTALQEKGCHSVSS